MVSQGHTPFKTMAAQRKKRPSVPSSSGLPSYGSGCGKEGAEGAKNLWARTGSLKDVTICTYNVRSLLGEDRLCELEKELGNITWDIVGLCEVRRRGEHLQHLLYTRGKEKSSIGGHTDEEVDMVYEEIAKLLDEDKANFTIVMGDFNAKVGKMEDNSEVMLGKFGTRNDRGDRLLEFALSRGLEVMTSFFKKKEHRKWTWQSPNGTTRNEIDFILTNRPDIVKDVSVLNRFNTGSDHSKVHVDTPIIAQDTDEDIPPVGVDEVAKALQAMKRGKAPGSDEVLVDVLKDGGDVILEQLAKLFTLCLVKTQTPDSWNNAIIILIHTKLRIHKGY
ncbi:craniofacial development protein 2-like [Lytechinus pictus]|uniref:craniofacial development protein 2-like n=1 Tax=Lytechinus pictus TaxID=7653 RepID=UPI0030BA13C6